MTMTVPTPIPTTTTGPSTPTTTGAPTKQHKNFPTISMIFGICSIVFLWFPFISFPCAAVALILGIISLAKKKAGKGMAIAGVATGATGLVATTIFLVCFISLAFQFYGKPSFDSADDQQRTAAYTKISSAMTAYAANHQGKLPTCYSDTVCILDLDSTFSSSDSLADLTDPKTLAQYRVTLFINGEANGTSSNFYSHLNPGDVYIQIGVDCDGNTTNSKEYRIIGYQDNGIYCQD